MTKATPEDLTGLRSTSRNGVLEDNVEWQDINKSGHVTSQTGEQLDRPSHDLSERWVELMSAETTKYCSIMGSMLHLTTRRQPDLCVCASVLGYFWNDAVRTTWSRQNCAMMLVENQHKHAINGSRENTRLNAYVNEIRGADAVFKWESRIEIFVRYGTAPLKLISTLQKTVSLSLTEGEHMALSEASKVVTCAQKVPKELNVIQDVALIHQDNQGYIYWALVGTTKQLPRQNIDIWHHLIMQQVKNGKIVLTKVDTARTLWSF